MEQKYGEVKGRISILMGIFNCEETLKDAIDSILSQTYDNWELIMCDDCSSDHTYQIAKSYLKRFPKKIILLQNKRNSKLAYTLNRCLKVASGEYVARMDGDDRSHPDRFRKQISFLQSHPEIDLVGTAMQRFFDDGRLGAIAYCEDYPDKDTPYRYGLVFNHATVMAKTSVYRALGGYTVSARTIRGQDRDLWYRFLNAGYKGANLSEALYFVREDTAAIKRRSPKVRWNSFKTEIIGYRMLHYPLYRYCKPIFRLSKVLIPFKIMELYRKWQASRQHSS